MEPSLDTFEDLENEIDKLKEEFYSSSTKNIFFKKSQKFECANQIMTRLPIEALLHKTCRLILTDTSKIIYIDYPIFKSYATPEMFEIISDYIIQVFRDFRSQYGYLEVVVNLDTFTISAFERYKHIIKIFCDKCFQQQNEFSKSLTMFSICNVPNAFDSIKRAIAPFMLEEVRSKIRLFGKIESESVLLSLGV